MTNPNNPALSLLERLNASKPQLEAVETKSLGTVYLRRQSGADQMRIHALHQEINANTMATLPRSTFAAVLGAVMLLNEDGSPIFTDMLKGYETLNACGVEQLEELYEALMKNHRGRENVEDAEKKSSSDQTSEPGTN